MKQADQNSGDKKPVIKHVWVQDRRSKIFGAIYGYFQDYSQNSFQCSSLDAAAPEADFHIYHRPQLVESVVNPCAAVIHHDLDDPTSEVSLEDMLGLYRQCDLLFCLNETQARRLNAAGLPQTRVIPHGYHPDLTEIRKDKALSSPPWTLGIFSRRYPNLVKGEAFLYELLPHLPPDLFKFILIGRDREKDVRFLKQQGFDAVQRPHGDYSDFIQSYRDIDALLILSVAEGGPASVPESLAAGIPLIARSVGMIADIPRVNENILTLTDDSAADAQAILKYLESGAHKQLRSAPMADYIHPWTEIITRYEREILACLEGGTS